MARHQRLYRRGTVWWYRRVLPPELRRLHGARELRRSTRCRDLAAAKRVAAQLDVNLDRLITRLVAGNAFQGVQVDDEIAAKVLHELRREYEEGGETLRATAPRRSKLEAQFDAAIELAFAQSWESQLIENDLSAIAAIVDPLLAEQGVKEVDADDAGYRKLLRRALEVTVEIHTAAAERELNPMGRPGVEVPALATLMGEARKASPAPPDQRQDAAAPEARADAMAERRLALVQTVTRDEATELDRALADAFDPSVNISIAYDGFVRLKCPNEHEPASRKARHGGWTPQQAHQIRTSVAMFVDLVGDLPLGEVGTAHAWRFRRRLADLPARHGRRPFEDMSPSESIRVASRIEAEQLNTVEQKSASGDYVNAAATDLAQHEAFVPRLAPKTSNKHIDGVATLFKLLREQGVLSTNPFAGVRYRKTEIGRHARQDRLALGDEEMLALLGSPLMVGRGVYTDTLGRRREDVVAYWLWLLMCFAGVRPEEGAQLEVEDVVSIDGIRCIAIRSVGSRTVKTLPSVRTVPIGDTLRRLGFLELVMARRAERERRLFPELSYRRGPARKDDTAEVHRYCSLSCQALQRMNDYLRRLDIAPGKTVYSVRHTFTTKLGNTEIPSRVIDELVGHALTGETLGRYFKGTGLPTLKAAIDAIDYGHRLEADEQGSPRLAPHQPLAPANAERGKVVQLAPAK